jgi:hypothetical protein
MLRTALWIGGIAVVGYVGYKWLTKPKTTSSSSNITEYSSLTPQQQENAAYIAQKFNPGYDVGSLQGAFGASPLLRVIY